MGEPRVRDGIDRLDRAIDAFGAINDLVVQAADTSHASLSLVAPDRLATLLGLVHDELLAARAHLPK